VFTDVSASQGEEAIARPPSGSANEPDYAYRTDPTTFRLLWALMFYYSQHSIK